MVLSAMTPRDQLKLLLTEYELLRRQYAEVGANDSDLNEAITEIMSAAADGRVLQNNVQYWLSYLYAQPGAAAAAQALFNISSRIAEVVPETGLDDAELEGLHDSIRYEQ